MMRERPDPDALLARVQEEETERKRGKLKIFFGMAPGVGKTYAMLESARNAASEGTDVVVGYIEPHVRPETLAMVLGLDLLPRRVIRARDKGWEEFDLEGALARKPQLILVDELAHTNAEGSIHPKRWQDVQDLLAAGINVFTTLNVQHLESLNDVVAQVTSIPVRETVPDRVFDQADEIELIDLAPDDLIDRLRAGRVYVSAQASRALENFFRKGNLIALRELALRKTAERVNVQAIGYRQQHEVSRIWATSERILVCVGPSPMSARLVRSTRRMAASLRAPWVALHVNLGHAKPLSSSDQQRLENNLRLAEDLGATVDEENGTDFASAVLAYCQHHNITRIVVGKPQMAWWRELLQGGFVAQLIRRSGDIDVYVISGDGEPASNRHVSGEVKPVYGLAYWGATAAVSACTVVCIGLSRYFPVTNLPMIYLSCVVGVSLIWGRGPSVLATILSVAALDFFLIPPYRTFVVGDSQYLLMFLVMLVTGLVTSDLASRVQVYSKAIRQRERRTAALFALSKELAPLPYYESVAAAAQRIISQALDVHVWILRQPELPDEDAKRLEGDTPPARHAGVIRWVFDHGRPAGYGTDTLPGTDATYLPLHGSEELVGVLGVLPNRQTSKLTISQMKLLDAFASQIALALERCKLASEAEKIRLQMETERLRNTLLSAVSHDLRTPLTGITGAASLLVDGNEKLTSPARLELAESILEESDRLTRLVANLLDLSKLEAGAISLQLVLQPIEETVGVALSRLERRLKDHPISTDLPDDLPPLTMDGMLIQQVLINLLENAANLSSPGVPIELRARVSEGVLTVEVADRGPGIPEGQEELIFDKFYRVAGQSQSGTGIGLTISRSIIELHGGKIWAENRAGGGAVFRFSIPVQQHGTAAGNILR
ncbi:DUF4118 domain-containing protein [Schlesneria sp. T3-172]|uniref:DUF4118 domain-containing protein n=1 Tax=Schlesneria sphaerica TaxID=3373610 RepID=UPI0037CA376B